MHDEKLLEVFVKFTINGAHPIDLLELKEAIGL